MLHEVFPEFDIKQDGPSLNGVPDRVMDILVDFTYGGGLNKQYSMEEMLDVKSLSAKCKGLKILAKAVSKNMERKKVKTSKN